MFLNVVYLRFIITCFLFGICRGTNFADATQDQTTMRANTLLDDADDIQRQLDNEARDRIKYGRPKTIWVFHLPTQFPEISAIMNVTRSIRDTKLFQRKKKNRRRKKQFTKLKVSVKATKEWDYKDQKLWEEAYPECGGRSQSPVDLPYNVLIKARGARKLLHVNYNVKPESMKLSNDGRQVVLTGKWPRDKHPYIYGGAAHSRHYIFHSLTLHWPSEHTVAGLQYPMETQALFLSAEYRTMAKALDASASDPLAFLAVSSLYKYGNCTDRGLFNIMKVAVGSIGDDAVMDPKPLKHFSPPLPEYACYQGSLTAPPCTESVLWLIRGRTLPVTREIAETARKLLGAGDSRLHFSRSVQPMNDRKAYYFKNSPSDRKSTYFN